MSSEERCETKKFCQLKWGHTGPCQFEAPSPAPAEGAEQFWDRKYGSPDSLTKGSVKAVACEFAEAYAASLREQLAQAQAENDRLTDAFLVYETIQPDGSLRATLKDVLKGLANAQFEVEALKGNVKDWRKAYEDAQRELEEANGRVTEYCTKFALKARDLEEALRVIEPIPNLLTNLAQILDVIKGEWGPAWGDWDQSQRDQITKTIIALESTHKALARSTGTKERGESH